MDIQLFCAYSGLINFLFCFFFAAFVWIKARHSKVNQTFALWSFFVSLWSIGYFLWLYQSNLGHEKAALFWVRFLNTNTVIIPATFFHFVCAYLHLDTVPFYKRLMRISDLYFSILVVLSFTPLMTPGVEARFWFTYWPIPGPAYHFFVGGFFLVLSYGFLLFFRALKYVGGIERKQLFMVTSGTILAFIGGSTNFFIFYWIPIPPILNVLVLSYVALIFYAILSYRLWDIQVVVRRTLVFTGLFTMVMGVVIGVATLTQTMISRYFQINSGVSTALGVMVAMILYDPCRKFLIEITDNFLFQKKFRLSGVVAQASRAIAFIQSLKWLARRIVAFLIVKCRIKHAVVYIRHQNKGEFIRGAIRGYAPKDFPPASLSDKEQVIRYLYESHGPIEIRRLQALIDKSQHHATLQRDARTVLEFLKTCKAEAMIPSFLRRRVEESGMGKEKSQTPRENEIELRNILILGPKKSDEPYSDEDLDVFYTLAQESAIALENARLYDEAVDKTRQLAQMNRELADTNERLQVTQASLIVAEKSATMVGMARAIGHEVNNPLTTVMMRTDMIYKEKIKKLKAEFDSQKDRILPESMVRIEKLLFGITDDISRASKAASRINAVIHTLTDILRHNKGDMSALSLRLIFHEALEATRFSSYEESLSGCEIKLDVASNLMIFGNLEQLLQVCINLIKNAYEALENTPNRKIDILGDIDPDNPKMARVEFKDNGPGIAADILPKIWSQGFSTKHRKDDTIGASGQGQGLFVCKHMVESVHHGSILCYSTPGKGALFVIKLPLANLEIKPHA